MELSKILFQDICEKILEKYFSVEFLQGKNFTVESRNKFIVKFGRFAFLKQRLTSSDPTNLIFKFVVVCRPDDKTRHLSISFIDCVKEGIFLKEINFFSNQNELERGLKSLIKLRSLSDISGHLEIYGYRFLPISGLFIDDDYFEKVESLIEGETV